MKQDAKPKHQTVTVEFEGTATVDVPVDATDEHVRNYAAGLIEHNNPDVDEVRGVQEVREQREPE